MATAPLNIAKSFRVALLQFHAGADKTANLAKVTQFAKRALESTPKPDMLVLPECFQSPYDVNQFRAYAEPIPNGETTAFLSALAKDNAVTVIGGSFPELGDDGKVYNTALAFDPRGELVAKHRKVHLFDISIPGGITFRESDSLSAGNKATVFSSDLGMFGLSICYDIRFPELATVAARKGAGAMIIPGAFNTVTGPKYWTKFAVSRAIDNQNYVILCSPARNTAGGYQAYGHSMVVDPNGEVVVEAGHDETVVFADISRETIENTRASIPITVQRRYDVYEDIASLTKASAL